MKTKSNLNILFFSTFLFFIASFTYCQNLYWAGFAFLGNKDQNYRYPVASDIFEKDKLILSSTLKKTLTFLNRKDITINFDLGKVSSGDAKALAFGLSDESIERILGSYGVTTNYTIYGQVLVFDFIDNKVIANYPVIATSTFTTKTMPTKAEDKKRFITMYLDINDDASIFSQWAKIFEIARVEEAKNIATIGIRNIILSDRTLKNIPARLKENKVFKIRTAQEFEASIASIHNVPLIPYTTGQALGGKGSIGLATRFQDNVSRELILPEKDFVFDILIKGFLKKETESDTQVQHLWGAYINLKLFGYEDSLIFSQSFRKIEKAIFSKSSKVKVLDNWIVNEVVLSNLIFAIMEQVKFQENLKIKELVKKGEDINKIKNDLNKIKEKFDLCI